PAGRRGRPAVPSPGPAVDRGDSRSRGAAPGRRARRDGARQRTLSLILPAMSKPHTASAGVADVAIVGGGVMGCAIALRLAQRALRVTVIERGIPGAEASSAAAGILGPQWEAEAIGPLLDLGLRSRALYPSFAVELRELAGIDVAYA